MAAPPEDGRRFGGLINIAPANPTVLASLIQTQSGNIAVGWVYNSTTEKWEHSGTDSIAANESIDIDLISVLVEDKNLDVNEDGRPNTVDISALTSIIGTAAATDPDILTLHDFNYDGVITSNDVDILTLILDSGADAGFINDTDASGTVDCDDLPSTIPAIGTIVSDTDYYVQIDRDLDGMISLEDRREFLLDLQPADSNLNGVVEATDFSAWIAANNSNDLAADANRNGVVEATDFSAWIAAFNTGGCP